MPVKAKNKLYEDVILENILRSSTDMAIAATDLDFRILYCNPLAEKIFEYTAQEVIGKTVMEIHAQKKVDPSRFERAIEIVSKEGAYRYTVEQKKEDGLRIIESRVSGIWDRKNNLIGFVIMSQDNTDHRRAEESLRTTNRTLKILSECNHAMIRAAGETELMGEVCRIIVEIGGHRLAWVGFAEQDDEKTVHPVAQAGFEQGYLETLNIVSADTERGRGPTGRAIRSGKPYIAKNILTDPDFAPWRDAAIQRGYASSIALPLFTGKEVFGALNIYAVEPDAFDTEEVAILTELAADLSYGIMTLRMRKEHSRAAAELMKYRKHLERLVEDRTIKLQNEINERKKVEIELKNYRLHLEELVKERTDDLRTAVKELQQKITERDLAEMALQESEERYRRITGAITDYIYTVCVESGSPVETKHSEACFAVTGYSIKDFTTDSYLWINMVPEEDRDIVRKQTDQLLSEHSPQSVKHRIIRKDGVVRWVENSIVPHMDKNGNLISYDGIVRDITERIQAEEAIQKSEEKYRLLFNKSKDCICLFYLNVDGKPGKFEEVNDIACENTGYTRDQLMQLSPHDIDASCNASDTDGLIKKLIADKKALVEMELLRKDGDKFPVEIHAHLFKINRKSKVLCIIRNITERKNIEKELEQHHEHLEKLVSERTSKLKVEISERKKMERELRNNMEELERFSRLASGREKQMIKLKEEINEYMSELGREAKYKIVN